MKRLILPLLFIFCFCGLAHAQSRNIQNLLRAGGPTGGGAAGGGGGGGITLLDASTWTSTANENSADPREFTINASATLAVLCVSGYQGANFYSGGTVSLESAAMTAVAGDTTADYSQGACFYKLNPGTGAAQTLLWDWQGSAASQQGAIFVFYTFGGVTAVRGTGGGTQTATTPYSTGALTTVAGDVVFVAAYGYATSNASVTSWTPTLTDTEYTNYNSADITTGTYTATGVSTTIATNVTANYGDGGVVAIIMVP